MNKRLAVITYGCQMNERDSEEVLGMLTAQGYEIAERPEAADVILLNTCSVRAHAEERAFGKMGELQQLKQTNPDLILGIIGCMAKLQREAIFKRLPQVDLIAGPAELYDLPYLLAEVQERKQRQIVARGSRLEALGKSDQPPASSLEPSAKVMAVGRAFRPLDQKPNGDWRRPGVTAFVTIMEGCDKACTYCIVPMTRGAEISRPTEEILDEIAGLAGLGYKEITLLGQNVNSYGKRFPDGSGYRGPLGRLRLLEENPEALLDFPALLRRIDGESSVERLRFTTSHPFDATPRLFEAMRDCGSVCEWLHLPVQSGSNRILRTMRRGYTCEAYLEKIERLRRLIPDISLSTDIIVGFPGETEEDFEQTISLMREVEYDNAFLFKYSPRPGTDAAAWVDDVPREVKEERNQILLTLQDEISLKRHQRLEGQTVEVLIEGPGKHDGQLFGRTRGNHGVILPACPEAAEAGREGPPSLIGETIQVKITKATAHTLFGERCNGSSH